jgi:hypothetical protein
MKLSALGRLRKIARTARRGGWILEAWNEKQDGSGGWSTILVNVEKERGQLFARRLPVARLRQIPGGSSAV